MVVYYWRAEVECTSEPETKSGRSAEDGCCSDSVDEEDPEAGGDAWEKFHKGKASSSY